MAVWYILRTFRIFYDHLVHIVLMWNIFSSFGIVHQEKSGNPVVHLFAISCANTLILCVYKLTYSVV
jgi:hypothetical protein